VNPSLVLKTKPIKAKVEDLKKKLVELNENFEVAKAKQEISEWKDPGCKRMLKSFGILRRDATEHP
jgi:hypothetical protein